MSDNFALQSTLHAAIIMDGNGRWAAARGLPRSEGHRAGVHHIARQGTLFELVPVPRALSSDCGVCITSQARPEDIASLLSSLHVDRCFFFNGKEFLQIVLQGPASVHYKEIDPREKE